MFYVASSLVRASEVTPRRRLSGLPTPLEVAKYVMICAAVRRNTISIHRSLMLGWAVLFCLCCDKNINDLCCFVVLLSYRQAIIMKIITKESAIANSYGCTYLHAHVEYNYWKLINERNLQLTIANIAKPIRRVQCLHNTMVLFSCRLLIRLPHFIIIMMK